MDLQSILDHLTPEERAILAENLLYAEDVAAELGLSSGHVINTYSRRHGDFPEPLVPPELVRGKNQVWLRSDIRRWRAAHPPPRRDNPPVTPPG